MKQDHRFAKSWLTQSEPGIGRHADSKSRERIGNPDELTFSDTVGSRALQAFNHVFDRHQTTCLDLGSLPRYAMPPSLDRGTATRWPEATVHGPR